MQRLTVSPNFTVHASMCRLLFCVASPLPLSLFNGPYEELICPSLIHNREEEEKEEEEEEEKEEEEEEEIKKKKEKVDKSCWKNVKKK